MDQPSHQDSMPTKRRLSDSSTADASFTSRDSDDMSDEEAEQNQIHVAKRQKTMSAADSPSPAVQAPDAIVDVCAEGDIILVVSSLASIANPMGIRVSSNALSFASPVFRRLLQPSSAADAMNTPISAPSSPEAEEPRMIHLPSDDGDSLYLLCNVLHLRNDQLPTKLLPDALFRFVACCAKYGSLVAASRAASTWLDYLYTRNEPETDGSRCSVTFKLLEAAYILNDAVFFSRFSARWVLSEAMGKPLHEIVPDVPRQKLAAALVQRQKLAKVELHADLDALMDPLAESLSDDAKHYIDCAPGDSPTPSEPSSSDPQFCVVDKEGATLYLSCLRDADLWPSTSRWPNKLSEILSSIENFRIPEYDASDTCFWCIKVDDKFATALKIVKAMHKERMWGLCLDCYKSPGGINVGECRVEHFKFGSLGESTGGISVRSVSGGGPNKG